VKNECGDSDVLNPVEAARSIVIVDNALKLWVNFDGELFVKFPPSLRLFNRVHIQFKMSNHFFNLLLLLFVDFKFTASDLLRYKLFSKVFFVWTASH